jgi:signal transduction histidine kinase
VAPWLRDRVDPNYVLGVVITGALFLLRPGISIPLFAINHAVYCILLFALTPRDLPTLLVLVENTGATIASLTAWLLFSARREEYFQRKTLEERNEELNDIMGITAHDLRSPLLGLRDLLSLASNGTTGERARGALDLARTSCGEMLALVGRLLDAHAFERQAENAFPLQLEDIRGALDAAAERARRDFSGSDVTVRCELPAFPAMAAINREALDQAIDNLLSNAMRFSPSGAEVVVRLHRDDRSWCCDVIDQGPGIPAEDRQALFNKFFRGSRRPARHEAGGGLGLFIAATRMNQWKAAPNTLPAPPGVRSSACAFRKAKLPLFHRGFDGLDVREMLLEDRERVLRELLELGIVAILGCFLELGDVLLVVFDHVIDVCLVES